MNSFLTLTRSGLLWERCVFLSLALSSAFPSLTDSPPSTRSQDNVYSTQVSLFDFDRIHLGCRLPGRLHARIYSQGRFAAGFNALAAHVKASWGVEEGTIEQDEDVEVGEQGEGEGVQHDDGEEEHEEHPRTDESLADDYDGPDSALQGEDEDGQLEADDGSILGEEDDSSHDHEQDREHRQQQQHEDDHASSYGGEGEGGGEDDFDLDQALAQLDGDDVVAVIEGAQEDYLLSEPREEAGGEETEEGKEQNEGETEGEQQEQQEEEGTTAAEEGEEEEEKQEEPVQEAEGGSEEPTRAEEGGEQEDHLASDAIQPSEEQQDQQQNEQQQDETVGEVDLDQAATEEAELASLVAAEEPSSTLDPDVGEDAPAPIAAEDVLSPTLNALEAVEPVPSAGIADTVENGTDLSAPVSASAVDGAIESAYGSAGAADSALLRASLPPSFLPFSSY